MIKKLLRLTLALLALVILAPCIYIGFMAYLAPQVLYGAPFDARNHLNPDDGLSWWFCRNTASGHVWIGAKGKHYSLELQYGSKCGKNTRYYYNPAASLETPGFQIVSSTAQVVMSVPQYDIADFQKPCPFAFPKSYYEKMGILISEVIELKELSIQNSKVSLTAVKEKIKNPGGLTISRAGFSGDTYFCGILD